MRFISDLLANYTSNARINNLVKVRIGIEWNFVGFFDVSS